MAVEKKNVESVESVKANANLNVEFDDDVKKLDKYYSDYFNDTDDVEVVEHKDLPKLYVARKKYTAKNGNQYWEYLLPVIYNGCTAEVRFKAADIEGYRLLDRLYGNVNKRELRYHQETRTDYNGNQTKYNIFEIIIEDEKIKGFEWTAQVRPARASDRSLLDNYIRYLDAKSSLIQQ